MTKFASRSIAPLAAAAGAIALLFASMWLANQGGVVPDNAEAAEKFFGTMYQGIRSMPIMLAVWLGVLGIGLPLRIWLMPKAEHRIAVQLALGLGAMLMLDWLLAACGWLNGWTAWGVCGIGTGVITYHFADRTTLDRWHPDSWPSPPWSLLLALPALGLLLVACTMPPGTMWAIEAFGYDVTSYHLEIPREWHGLGQMQSLKNNVYSHLPMFAEAGYMKLAVMHGSVFDAIYTIHFFHASVALLAAATVGRLVSGFAGPVAGAVSGAALLATPWTIITGSMAYSEMFVMVFGAAALVAMFDPLSATPRGALVVGLLLGLATLAKLTAGGFIALPIGAVMVGRLFFTADKDRSPQQKSFALIVMILGGLLMLSPYLIRNFIWTGNPVFPFAASAMGQGHWSDEQVARWNNAHHSQGVLDGLSKLPRQWLLNTGYGAIGGSERDERDVTDIARFDQEMGLPLLWILVAVGCVLAFRHRPDRHIAVALSMVLAFQLLFWLFFTHHQSRFLIPTLLPASIFVGLAIGRIAELSKGKRDWLAPMLSVVLIVCLTMTSYGTFQSQTPQVRDPATKQMLRFPPYLLVDSLVDPRDVTSNQPGRFAGRHPLNQLPPTSKTLLVGDANQVLYIQRAFLYNTAFDRSLLAELLKQQKGNALGVTIALVRAGFTHVWINFSELERLAGSYGVDAELEPARIKALVQSIEQAKMWQRVTEVAGVKVDAHIGLYALPMLRAAPASGEKSATSTFEKAPPPEKK